MEHLVPENGYRTLERARAKHAPEDAQRLARTRAIRSVSADMVMVMGISVNEPDGCAPSMPRRKNVDAGWPGARRPRHARDSQA